MELMSYNKRLYHLREKAVHRMEKFYKYTSVNAYIYNLKRTKQ